jgi:undecaprenyl-diphosphatase
MIVPGFWHLEEFMLDWLTAVILGLVEGLTEFIPVSSTGHLILAGHLLGFEGERAATFEVFIQLGAILAVVMLYFRRFLALIPRQWTLNPQAGFSNLHGLLLLALTAAPAGLIGFLFHGLIKEHLFSPAVVAIGLALGGIAILLIEPRLPPATVTSLDGLRWREALLIGVFQILSLWPGVSRAAATILGGMILGVERKTAAEYSFLVAVPLLFGAGIFDVVKSLDVLETSDIPLFALGFGVAFVSAWLAIRYFLRLLATHTLSPFGWYRIALALVVLAVLA